MELLQQTIGIHPQEAGIVVISQKEEIIFKNNQITQCEFAAAWETSPVIRCTPKVLKENSEEFVHQKLILQGNTFRIPREEKHSIWLEYLKEVTIENNTFDAPYIVYQKCVGKINESNNKICYETEK